MTCAVRAARRPRASGKRTLTCGFRGGNGLARSVTGRRRLPDRAARRGPDCPGVQFSIPHFCSKITAVRSDCPPFPRIAGAVFRRDSAGAGRRNGGNARGRVRHRSIPCPGRRGVRSPRSPRRRRSSARPRAGDAAVPRHGPDPGRARPALTGPAGAPVRPETPRSRGVGTWTKERSAGRPRNGRSPRSRRRWRGCASCSPRAWRWGWTRAARWSGAPCRSSSWSSSTSSGQRARGRE
jgi:hypothetical protein